MFRCKFLALCVLGCLALGASGVRAEANNNVELRQDVDFDIRKIDIEHYDGIIDAIIEYLKDFFAQATTNCLKEVAKNCKKIWYNPKKLLKCAKEYFKEHEGECAIPDTLEYETMLMSIYNEDDDVDDVDLDISKIDIENYDGIIDAIIDYLKDFFQQATVNCLKEVAKNCKKLWYNPKKLLKCAKEYFKEHQGECAIPDSLQYEMLLMSIPSDDDVKDIDIRELDIENFDGIIDAIIEYLKDFFAQATTNCLKEVAKNCKKIWYNPKKLLKCAKEYFKEHEGECAIPDTLEYEMMLMSIYGEDEDAEDVELELGKIDIENYDGIINTIIDYLKDFFQQATVNCLKEVAKNCKKIWYNPKKLLKCAKEYFHEHQGECAIPDAMRYENLIMTIDNDTELVEYDESIETLENPVVKAIVKALLKAFSRMAKKCIQTAANKCQGHWPNVPALVDCAGKYFKANKGRCALG